MGKTLLSHPLGSPFSSHAAIGLHSSGLLEEVVCAFCYNERSIIAKAAGILPSYLEKYVNKQLERRAWLKSQSIKVTQFPLIEFLRMGILKTGVNKLLGMPDQALTDILYKNFDIKTAKYLRRKKNLAEIRAVYAYEDGAAETFKFCKSEGVKCVYDLPILYFEESRNIETEEAALFPGLKQSLFSASISPDKLFRKKMEVQLSDHIITASSITRDSLVRHGIPLEKISVAPYGIGANNMYQLRVPAERKPKDTLKVIFVGRIGPRKGVHYLLEAWKKISNKHIELTLIGVNEFEKGYLEKALANAGKSIKVLPSMPRAELFKYYAASDLLILPSLVEGFGMVLLEAMSCGLPVIASENTAARDFINEGQEGFIIPIRDTAAICDKITWACDNREALSEMGKKSRLKSDQMGWETYESKISSIVGKLTA